MFIGLALASGGIAFYVPSLDMLVSGDARDLGKTMARQLSWQDLGMMGCSLLAGALFDEALRRATPPLAWSVPAIGAPALLVGGTTAMRRASA